jgi:predicted kinase
MIVLMAGLPGTGKSTLCRALDGAVLDKDIIRAALFGKKDIEFSTQQDDFCMNLMLEAAAYILKKDPLRIVFLDGRPFSKRYQIDQVIDVANELKQPWRILECVCSEATVRTRLDEQTGHPAGDRDFELYLRVRAGFEEITFPKTVIDTDQPIETCLGLARAALI